MPNLAKGNSIYRPSQGTYGVASTTLQQLPAPSDHLIDDSANLDNETVDLLNDTEETPPSPSSEVSPNKSPNRASLLLLAPAAASSSVVSTLMSAASSSKCKQSALSAVQSPGARKKQHTNAGTSAMDRIKESLDHFNSTVAKSILVHPERIHSNTSPER